MSKIVLNNDEVNEALRLYIKTIPKYKKLIKGIKRVEVEVDTSKKEIILDLIPFEDNRGG